jgi:hypothetical protein
MVVRISHGLEGHISQPGNHTQAIQIREIARGTTINLILPTVHDSYGLDKGQGSKPSNQSPTTSLSSCPPLWSPEDATNPCLPGFAKRKNS